jgi:hypothetical protein
MDTKDTTAMSEWTPKPIDPDWKTKLTPELREMWVLSQAPDSVIANAIKVFCDLVVEEYPHANLNFIVDGKGKRVEVGVFVWPRELTPKHQPVKDPHAPQLLGKTFGYREDDEPRLKQLSIVRAWFSAFDRTKRREQIKEAVMRGENPEDFCKKQGWTQ